MKLAGTLSALLIIGLFLALGRLDGAPPLDPAVGGAPAAGAGNDGVSGLIDVGLGGERRAAPGSAREPESPPEPSAAGASAGLVSLAGTVLFGNDQPVAGVEVQAWPVDEGGQVHFSGSFQGNFTDGRGGFRIDGMEPGTYELALEASEPVPVVGSSRFEAGAEDVVIRADGGLLLIQAMGAEGKPVAMSDLRTYVAPAPGIISRQPLHWSADVALDSPLGGVVPITPGASSVFVAEDGDGNRYRGHHTAGGRVTPGFTRVTLRREHPEFGSIEIVAGGDELEEFDEIELVGLRPVDGREGYQDAIRHDARSLRVEGVLEGRCRVDVKTDSLVCLFESSERNRASFEVEVFGGQVTSVLPRVVLGGLLLVDVDSSMGSLDGGALDHLDIRPVGGDAWRRLSVRLLTRASDSTGLSADRYLSSAVIPGDYEVRVAPRADSLVTRTVRVSAGGRCQIVF